MRPTTLVFCLCFVSTHIRGQTTPTPQYTCNADNDVIDFTLSSSFHSAWQPSMNCSLTTCNGNSLTNASCLEPMTPCYDYQTINNVSYCAPGILCSILTSCDNITNNGCSSNTSVCVVNSCCSARAVCLPLSFTELCPVTNGTYTSTATSTSSSRTSTGTIASTTSTTAFPSCASLQWNQTGIPIAGTGSNTVNSNGFKHPSGMYIDANNTLYICDQQNNRIQMWTKGSTNGITVAGSSSGTQGTSSILLNQPIAVTFDKNGFMYVSDQGNNRVQRFAPNSLNGSTVAGQATGTNSNALNGLDGPAGIAVDNNSNLYIADTDNQRLVLWAPNATSGSILISSSLINDAYGLLLAPSSTNRVYMSAQGGSHSVYLWKFNASIPDVTLTQVNDTPSNLGDPSGIALDLYGNLYVADRNQNRVIMYCVNSTVGTVVVDGSGGASLLSHPIAISLDSNLNMYVLDEIGNDVIRYARL